MKPDSCSRARNLTLAEAEKEKELEKDRLKIEEQHSGRVRKLSSASNTSKGGRPKSMVTYDKGPPRDLGYDKKIDNRELGLSHDE